MENTHVLSSLLCNLQFWLQSVVLLQNKIRNSWISTTIINNFPIPIGKNNSINNNQHHAWHFRMQI